MVFILIIHMDIDESSWQILSNFPTYLVKILPPAHISVYADSWVLNNGFELTR